MKKMISGIYKITNPKGAVYIGQSFDIRKRWLAHKLNRHLNTYIANSIKKYGYENHLLEVIHELPNDCERQYFDALERLYLEQYQALGFKVMNLKSGGTYGRIYIHKGHSEETKRKIGLANKGRRPSDECLRKAAEACSKRIMPEWHKEKIRNSIKPVWDKERRAAIAVKIKETLAKKFASGWKRCSRSEETKRKISEKNKGGTGRPPGYRHSEETKRKIGLANSKKIRA